MYSAQTFEFDDESDRRGSYGREDSDPTLSQALYEEEESGVPIHDGFAVDEPEEDNKDRPPRRIRCACCSGTCCSTGMGKVRVFFIVLAVVLVGLATTYLTLTILKKQGKFVPYGVAHSPQKNGENPQSSGAIDDGNGSDIEYDNDGANEGDDIPEDGNSTAPTASTERVEAVASRIVEVTEKDVLLDSRSPQSQALMWLVNDDERKVDPDHPNLIQRYALATLYFATQGPSWKDTSLDPDNSELMFTNWLTPLHECEWDFVSCDGEVGIGNLRGRLLSIKNKIFSKKKRKRVLGDEFGVTNYFEEFDAEFGQINRAPIRSSGESKSNDLEKELVEVDLGNLSEGSIYQLDLTAMNLVGVIPLEIGSLDSLEILQLSSNHLVGPIPVTLGSIQGLEVLQLHDNKLGGTIPASLGNLPNLRELKIGYNNLSGDVPESVCELGLAGFGVGPESLPDVICSCCTDDQVDEGDVPLDDDFAPFPTSVIPISTATEPRPPKDSPEVGVRPPSPPDFGNENNTDTFAGEGNITASIERLGAFVDRVQEVTEKEVLLESGSPQNKALIWIVRDDERQVEPDHPNLIQRYALATLFFATEGPSWANSSKQVEEGHHESSRWLTGVHECEWDFTSCSGEVGVVGEPKSPTEKGVDVAKNLVEVDLGTLTEGSLTGISLQTRNLVGNIPAEIGALEGLEILDLGMNGLSGPIPVTIGTLKNLHTLKLNDNSLNGTIPESIGSLPNLEVLRLENNNLTGSVPPSICSLELFPKFGTDILKLLPNVSCSCCSEEHDEEPDEIYSTVPATASENGTISPCEGDECAGEENFTEEVSASAVLPTELGNVAEDINKETMITEEQTNKEISEELSCSFDFEKVRTQTDGAVAVAGNALLGLLNTGCDSDTLCGEEVDGVLVMSFSKLQDTQEYDDFIAACQAHGDGYRVCTMDSEYTLKENTVKLQARPVCAPLTCKTEDDLLEAITTELSCQGATECSLTSLTVQCYPDDDLNNIPSSRGED